MNFIIGVALLLLVNSVIATDYCRKNLCTKGTHVACRNNGAWGSTSNCGRSPRLHDLTQADKDFILDSHNKHRQAIASGSLARYEPAANMTEVIWNDELAYLGCLHAKKCQFGHDECRNTDDHPHAGQNIGISGSTGGFIPFQEAYTVAHTGWFDEHEFCDMNNIRKFEDKPTTANKVIGHFTQLVADNVDQVGCCVSMFEQGKWKKTLTVCNYSYISVLNRPIYVPGKPKCKKFSKKYKSLCVN